MAARLGRPPLLALSVEELAVLEAMCEHGALGSAPAGPAGPAGPAAYLGRPECLDRRE